jgi:PAS domain S-box-containing protein
MGKESAATLHVAVVDDGLGDHLADAAVAAERVPDTATALERVRADEAEAVVVADPTDYERVREDDPTVPVVVVSDVDREWLDRIVGDGAADQVSPGADLSTALEGRLRGLVDTAETAWRLADFADEAVVEFDLKSHALLAANEQFYDTWGWDEKRLTEASIADLRETDITHELRGQGRGDEGEEDLEWIRDEDPVDSMVRRAVGGLYEIREWHCTSADGDPFKTDVRVVADGNDQRGYIAATVPDTDGPSIDPTNTTEGEMASMLRALVEHVPMSVYFKDCQSRHVLASENVADPFIESPEGKIIHTPEGVIGKTDFDLYPPEGAQEGIEEDRTVMETGRPLVDKVEHVQPPHGRPLFFQTTKAPWYGEDGRVYGTVGITVDITDQKRRERELDRQNERLEEFAAIVSHDLRNPLNVAKGRLDLYRQTGDESELDAVAEMHDRMEGLIEDVLTFAREGERVEDPQWFDPREQVQQAWAAVDTADATLDIEWGYYIRGDPGRFVRLLENCFRNAVEHGSTSPRSGAHEDAVEHAGEDVAVTVGTLTGEHGFYVEDDGPGIPESDREDVFDRGMTTDENGTGFGLAILREIADAHGWSVRATESETGGARFEVVGVPRGDALVE